MLSAVTLADVFVGALLKRNVFFFLLSTGSGREGRLVGWTDGQQVYGAGRRTVAGFVGAW